MMASIRGWGLIIAIVVGLAGIAKAQAVVPARVLEIYFVDVQGGAATLLVTPEGESVLIDSGWPGFDDRDPKRIVHVLKDLAGCDQLDHLVTTHWHRDHFGGVAGLARQVRIAHFWDRGLPEDDRPGLDFPDGPATDDPLGIAYRSASAGKRKALRAGDSLPLKRPTDPNSVKAEILASGGRVTQEISHRRERETLQLTPPNPACANAPPDQPADRSDNARSLALRFSMGKFQFFDAGDLTWNIEKQLACPFDRVGPVELYQVTHHGMDSSNNPVLVQTIAPTVAIMNNGSHKGGSAATVRMLRSIPSIKAAYQLHRNVVTGAEDNTDPSLIANQDEAGGTFIRVRVTPDGSKFTVQIGENGPERTFESR
jgi:beta-lactamase superfamily II metal-dependent hydrolase